MTLQPRSSLAPNRLEMFFQYVIKKGYYYGSDNRVKFLPIATDELTPCAIRPRCRWWQQEGKAACSRCPQVVTDNYNPSELMIQAASPKTTTI
jgi:hypothetical protein